MPLYVLALTDSPIDIRTAGGRAVRDVEIEGIHAICQRRTKAPALSDAVLRDQHRAVLEIADRSRAILPVRFGALLAEEALVNRLRSHETEIRRALDDVRDRVQMTTRVLGTVPAPPLGNASSGRQYLEQRRRIVSPELPATARVLLEALEPLVYRERREPGAAGLLATVYHLVDRANVKRYAAVVTGMIEPNIISTGPWPPFAFTPELW